MENKFKNIIIGILGALLLVVSIILVVNLIPKNEEVEDKPTNENEETLFPEILNVDVISGRDFLNITFEFINEEIQFDYLFIMLKSNFEESDYCETTTFFNLEQNDILYENLEFNQEYELSFLSVIDNENSLIKTEVLKPNLGSKENPKPIENSDDLYEMKSFPDDHYILENDIDCNEANFSSIFSQYNKFTGSIDCNNYSIKNMTKDGYGDFSIFGHIGETGLVENLNVENVLYISRRYTNLYIGIIAEYNEGTIRNVEITDVFVTTNAPNDGEQTIGSIVGVNKETGIIENCNVTNVEFFCTIPNNVCIGGAVGWNQGNIKDVKIDNFRLRVRLTNENQIIDYFEEEINYDIQLEVGGFTGCNQGSIINGITICEISVYIEGSGLDMSHTDIDIYHNERNENILSLDIYIGGFAGSNYNEIINSCADVITIEVDFPFVDNFIFGGFVGVNDTGVIELCELKSTFFDILIGENTNYIEQGIITIGHIVGINTNSELTNISVEYLNKAEFSTFHRYKDINNDEYYIEEIIIEINELLM